MGFAHNSNDRNLSQKKKRDIIIAYPQEIKGKKLTPLAVLIGLAFNLGNKAFL